MIDGFIDRLVDWRAFELFVRDMYARDQNLTVEHNVIATGKSGAQRQIDVRFTHRVGGHTYVTLVECKLWKAKVDRKRIDELAATIEDLNASKGVMFTTTGYEPGAEAYARHKGIDLFLVRDLTDSEWGLPGRLVSFYLHFYTAKVTGFEPRQAQVISHAPDPPSSVSLPLVFRPDGQLDDAMTLHSVIDGSSGPNLLTLIADARALALQWLAQPVGLLDDGADHASRTFVLGLELDLASSTFRDLRRSFGVIRLEALAMDLVVRVEQSLFGHDRGAGLDLALAVEDYVTRQRSVVTRHAESSSMAVADLADDQPGATQDDVLENGMVLRIFTEPWVALDAIPDAPQRTATLRFHFAGARRDATAA